MASADAAVCTAPADYGELFRTYGAQIRRVAWRQLPGAQPQDVEDCLQYILQQFIKNDVISQYKPGTISEYNHRPVTFGAFIMNKVPRYCHGWRDTLRRRKREALLVDAPAEDGQDTRWIDALAGGMDEYPSLADSEVLDRLRAGLARRNAPSVPLVPLFDAMAERHRDGRPMTPASLRRDLGAESTDQVAGWFDELRAALREVASPKRYEVGGMLLSAVEVRAAIDAQKNARGNRVLPAFADAGHRLAGAGKDWYIRFAKQTMARYPECRVAKGGHYPGGHFGRVKAALIYGLERMLDAEPEVVVRPPDRGPWTLLEEAIARLPGATPERVAAVMEAARMVMDPDLAAA